MTRFLTIERVLLIYRYLIEQSGGTAGLRDRGMLEASLAQPQITFDSVELYSALAEWLAAHTIPRTPRYPPPSLVHHPALGIGRKCHGQYRTTRTTRRQQRRRYTDCRMTAHIRTLYEQHVKPLSALDRRRLFELLRREIEHEATEPRHSILELAGLGAEIWQGIDAQAYINELRSEWDSRP